VHKYIEYSLLSNFFVVVLFHLFGLGKIAKQKQISLKKNENE